MTGSNLQIIINNYGGFDGALVEKIDFVNVLDRRVSIELKMFLGAGGVDRQRVRVSAIGRVLFSWCELPWDTNLVLNWPVKLIHEGGYEIIDFDPLHAKQRGGQISVSAYFIGGAELRVEELADEVAVESSTSLGR